MEQTEMKYSIALVSKNNHDVLEKSIEKLIPEIKTAEEYEIILVEELGVKRPIRKKNLHYYWIPERNYGIGYARNFALERCKGDIVIFLDDDVRPHSDWFQNLISPFEDPEVGGVGGAIFPERKGINTVGKCISLLGFPAGGVQRSIDAGGKPRETEWISTGNCAFRRKYFEVVGGFDPLLRGCEDTDFFQRLNRICKTMYAPDAIVYHRQRSTYRQVFQWFLRRGRDNFFWACKNAGPVCSFFLPVRSNFFIKLTAFFLCFLFLFHLHPAFGILFTFIGIAFFHIVIFEKQKKNLGKSTCAQDRNSVALLRKDIESFPISVRLGLVKFIMDLGFEIGRLSGFFIYLNHRFFHQPIILTFHHVSLEGGVHDPRYSVQSQAIGRLLNDIEKMGERIISLGTLCKMRKKSPYSIFFDKFVVVTFDDAYRSVYIFLKRLLPKAKFPVTVFAPMHYMGKAAEWSDAACAKEDLIMSREELLELYKLGVEIGSHAMTHPQLTGLTTRQCAEELLRSYEMIKIDFPTTEIMLSYPFGAFDSRIAQIAAEIGYCGAVANFASPIRRRTNPWMMPRYNFFNESSMADIRRRARAEWRRNMLRDLRDAFYLITEK